MEAGAQPVWLPAIAITALTEPAALAHLDAALSRLDAYSHIAFVSTNSFHGVMGRLAKLHRGRSRPPPFHESVNQNNINHKHTCTYHKLSKT
jgi:uroporphyrinogen-III synthase